MRLIVNTKEAIKNAIWVPIAWAVACDLRRFVTRASCANWPTEVMTQKEKRAVARLKQHLANAEHEIMVLQSSLSERSKSFGVESPDYKTARESDLV